MKITYIEHSGFLMEWDTCYWLFDYYKGEIPAMDLDKKLFVFVSHNHKDHFNPKIFELKERHPNILYVLSSDIKLEKGKNADESRIEKVSEDILMVKPHQEYELQGMKDRIQLKTLKSTDSGVAFLLQYQGKTIYHAGDLNLWVWKEETKQYNNNMKANFIQEMSLLKDLPIDIAFAPLDPRQEEYYYLGLEGLINTAVVKYLFPMHFWGKPEVIEQFKQERRMPEDKRTEIIDIQEAGQKWRIS